MINCCELGSHIVHDPAAGPVSDCIHLKHLELYIRHLENGITFYGKPKMEFLKRCEMTKSKFKIVSLRFLLLRLGAHHSVSQPLILRLLDGIFGESVTWTDLEAHSPQNLREPRKIACLGSSLNLPVLRNLDSKSYKIATEPKPLNWVQKKGSPC